LVDVLLQRQQEFEPGKVFHYSDVSAHLVAECSRLRWNRPTVTVLGRFSPKPEETVRSVGHLDPPEFSEALPDPFVTEFLTAGFGSGTDPIATRQRDRRSDLEPLDNVLISAFPL
jgi:hypothetical protein